MTYFAKVNFQSGTKYMVTDVISADQSFIDTIPGQWILTDYNTYGNVHYASSPPADPKTPDGGIPVRANYAGINYTYDTAYTVGEFVGVFYAPQPYPSWVLDPQTFLWEAPIPYPTDGKMYYWDEATLSWVLYPNQ